MLNTDVVANTNDSGTGSLRATISSASPGDTIAFARGVTGTITLTSGVLDINKKLDIEGPGAGILEISGDSASAVFVIDNQTATIAGLSITDGFDNAKSGGINNGYGALTLTDCTISGNQGSRGGGIYNYGTLTATNCTRMTVLEPVKFTAAYNQSTNSVTLTVKGKPTFVKGSEIQINASAPTGVCNTAGVLLKAADTVFKIPVKAKGIRGNGVRH